MPITIDKQPSPCKKQVFGTKEWASFNENIIDGCAHDCKYCYSKEMAIRFKRRTPNNWKEESIRLNSFRKNIREKNGTIMFPSAHDIHPSHLDQVVEFLEKLLSSNNELLIVTKPHFECIKAICKAFGSYKEQILFRFTIGSSDSSNLKFWEPGAPSFEERISCLEYAYEHDFFTSLSCEPLLDDKADALIEKTLPYVTDSIWIGKPNSLIRRMKLNGVKDKKSISLAEALLSSIDDNYFIDLYREYKSNSKIKWKESVKKIVGIDVPTEIGLDE